MLSLLFVCLLLSSCCTLCFGQASVRPLELTPGHAVSALVTPQRSVILRLVPASGQAEEVFLDVAAPDVSFRFVSNEETQTHSGRLATEGWAVIPVSATDAGEVILSAQGPMQELPGLRVRAEAFSILPGTLPLHIQAARHFTAAQSLRHSLRKQDLLLAVAQFRQAAADFSRCGDRYGEALALAGEGESQIEISHFAEASEIFRQTSRLKVNDDYLQGWLAHLEARVYLDQWEPGPARGFAQEELRLGLQANDLSLTALARTDLAGVAYWSEDDDANRLAAQAHDEAIAAGVPHTLAMERRWKGWLEENDARNVRAIAAMTEAERYFARAGDARQALEATAQVAVAVALNGNLYSALAKFSQLEPAAKASGNDTDYGVLLENMGNEHLDLGNPGFAEVYFHRAETVYSRAHFRFGLMAIYGRMCEAELRLHQRQSAADHCRRSLTLARQIADPALIGTAEYQLGLADRQAGKETQAFADFTDAASHSHIYSDLQMESNEHIQLGELLEHSGKQRAALAQYLKAESLTESVEAPANLLEAQYSTARWYARDGQYEKARAELQPALETIETARQTVFNSTLQAAYFAAERKCYELAIDLRMHQFARDSDSNADALALELSEQSRARGLLDAQAVSLAGHEQGNAQAGVMRANIAVDQAFDRRLKLLLSGAPRRDLEVSAAQLTSALGDLERSEDARHAATAEAPKPAPTISAVDMEQASLHSGMTFLEYALGEERSYLWVITDGKLKSFVLPPRAPLERLVTRWRSLATSEQESRLQRLSANLSCVLLGDAIVDDMQRIVVVADGALALLPFAALPARGCSGLSRRPLVLDHEITSTPSLSVFLSPKPKPPNTKFRGQVAIIADPVFDAADPRVANSQGRLVRGISHSLSVPRMELALPRLVNAGYEANAIQQAVSRAAGKDQVFLAQGFNASLDTVLSPAMRDYRIWHLATHGVYDQTMPEFSGLVLSTLDRYGSARPGFLKAQDIARLTVPATLVVLSACDSAAGRPFNGEGVMGLSYAFLRAGAKQVIATLWAVDDAKSTELMVAFYEELMRNGGHTAAALRTSQLKLIQHPASSAPYYWAGFELTALGD